jgi:phosphatidylserine decarboxylase
MRIDPIIFYNRRTGELQREQIYGEVWLRWIYGSQLGKMSLALVVRRAWFSAWYGWRMNQKKSADRVLPFIVKYDMDVDEFTKPATAYRTFNEFFYRRIKKDARPIAVGAEVAVFPADGRHLVYQEAERADGFYIKGKKFGLNSLLGDDEVGREFEGGAILISRLCPVDYHRFHFPVAGTPMEARLINGWLYSVSPIALRCNPGYLTENKRMVTLIDTVLFGRVAMIEIGATMVGTIIQTYTPDQAVAKGDDKGMFTFGGSCVVTLFQRGRIRFDQDLVEHATQYREVYARMGERLGVAL